MFRFLLIALSLIMAGCASTATFHPADIGVSPEQWLNYDESQRQQAISEYQQSQADRIKRIPPNSQLEITIQNGTVFIPGLDSQRAFQPVTFMLKNGQCNQRITLVDAQNPHKKARLSTCYKGDTIYLDPSNDADNPYGSLKFQYLPNWKRGFTYPGVSSTGEAKLSQVSVLVREAG